MTFCMIGLKTWRLTSLYGLEAYWLRMNGQMGRPGATPTGAVGNPAGEEGVSTSTSMEARVAGGTRTVPLGIHTSAAPAQSQSMLNDGHIYNTRISRGVTIVTRCVLLLYKACNGDQKSFLKVKKYVYE